MSALAVAPRSTGTPGSSPARSSGANAALLEAPSRGILLIVASTVFFAGADALTKVLASSLPVPEIAWIRYVIFSLLTLPLLLRNGGVGVLRSGHPGLQLLRGLATVGSTLLFTASLQLLPVADATAINFVSPILITALSIPLLGEVVGWRRWVASAVGLVGVLIIIRPGTSTFGAAALLPLCAAASWASAAVITRMMSGMDRPITTLTYTALVGTAALSLVVPIVWVVPSWGELGLGLCIGLLSTAGHWLVVLAYRHAPASTVAPFSYVQLIWAGILGLLVFRAVPDLWTVMGAGIIALSGLYTAHRERVRARSSRA